MQQYKNNKGENCTVQLADGSTVSMFSKELFQQQLNHWQGWMCEGGYSIIYVHTNGDVYSCESKNNFLGSLEDNSFSLQPSPALCRMPQCSNNPNELKIKKFKIDR
jgi:hypothetical protein